jgi:acyl transferase domain-containing protein/acyl carrier protein
MESTAHRAIAIVGVGAILPDAPNAPAFWENIKAGKYSITDVPADRWDPNFYYDADHSAPDKTYSRIGGWVREYAWEPMKWHLPIPPRVSDGMDVAQRWAVACTREALEDYGYPKRQLDLDRTAVILGNAMAGEKHYLSSLRVFFPEYAHELAVSPAFVGLPESVRRDITEQLRERMGKLIPAITEDTMPGELANCMAGRIANLYNFHGPNFVCDAACASAMAAISSAVKGLIENEFDVVVTGGIDRNMGAPTFVKFCKIGALSATGTRPYAEGADGFVMGEGAAIFIMKRLADAERDQDKIYAVLRGFGGSSDGKGKGITAPNPIGQKFCVERAWKNAGLTPMAGTLIEGHGTSTRVGDVVEAQSMAEILSSANLPANSVALGSVKSNIGHLKGAAGAAGMLKAAFALHNKMLPPSLHCEHPSPDIDFTNSPLYVNTELKPWKVNGDGVRRAGVSAFGFGGTNFHMVMEEYVPGRLNGNGKKSIAVPVTPPAATQQTAVQVTSGAPVASKTAAATATAAPAAAPVAQAVKTPLRGALVIGADSVPALIERLREELKSAQAGTAPAPAAPSEADLRAPERLTIDYGDASELATKCGIALKAFQANQAAFWKALRAQGIFRGHGPAPKVAFLYTGQGSQYVNMLRTLREKEPIIAETFAEADRIMVPLIGKPLTDIIFVDPANADAVARAEEDLRQTAITQPAVITTDTATTRLLAAYGVNPDFAMGHSVGEYGALVASEAMPFEDAIEAVSARGREMTKVSMEDNGKMAAVFAPIPEVERILKSVNGYVVIANVNSNSQCVIGGGSKAIDEVTQTFLQAGYNVVPLPVSHAFHTSIVAPASVPLRQMLGRLRLQQPVIPIVSNVSGDFYQPAPDMTTRMLDILAQQVAAPVQFVKGLQTLYNAGARVFVEVGPKKALQGFAEDVLGSDADVFSLFTNHPKIEDLTAFNQALCGLYAAGLGRGVAGASLEIPAKEAPVSAVAPQVDTRSAGLTEPPAKIVISTITAPSNGNRYVDPYGQRIDEPEAAARKEAVVITGAALGLPGADHIFDDANIGRILNGDQFIGSIPDRLRTAMLDKNITRLVKSASGDAVFETITDVGDVIKLAGRGRAFDLQSEFGVSSDRVVALDRVTRLAIAAGIDALRDAGIPLVMRYKTTTKGTQLPDRWGLPDSMRDNTGVIFGSAFPGYDAFAEIIGAYHADHARREELAMLEKWSAQSANGHSALGQEIARRIDELRAMIEKNPYVFDRRFLFRTLSMGHSQFAEYIGARGPNTQINSACATTSTALSLAEDWIRAGRCRRVIILSADDVTSDNMIEWFGAGFLASGAAATDDKVEEAATPFDKRRHGLIIGMGAAALMIESADAARERGIQPICEVLGGLTANSAFHGTRLDVQHITGVMEQLISQVEKRHGISRKEIAPRTVFVSHETYTPARGGSASAEIFALRKTFGDAADQIVIANTKGYTGHAMATGIEEVLAVKALETGMVPAVPNFKEVDPELGRLNLAKGGKYPVEYALRLGAGFGSQISMALLHWVKPASGDRPTPDKLGYAYRIADPAAWNAWISRVAGRSSAELEIVKRTLRVRDVGPQARVAKTVEDSRPVTAAAAAVVAPVSRPAAAAASAPAVNTSATPSAVALAAPVQANVVPVAPVVVETTPAPVPPKPDAQLQPAMPVPATAAPAGSVKDSILALAVEKTGYPADMLDLDLDLEADLGVDTVKQAEIFTAIREMYEIPRDENRKLRDYPTLAHVIRFVYEKRPDLAKKAAAPAPETVTPAAVSQAQPVVIPPAPAPAAAAPAVAAAPQALTTESLESIQAKVLEIVAEKTGYPPEMLDLDLDLEADLGIDTVKQAEMFAAVRAAYNIPRDENMKLRDFPTLAHVIKFAQQRQPAAAQSTAAAATIESPAPITAQSAAANSPVAAAPPVVEVAAVSPDEIKAKVLEIVAEKTGYPPEMLDLDLDLEADLGIDTVKQAEMFAAVRAAYNIPRDENMKLRDFPTLAHVIKFAQQRQPGVALTSVVAVTQPDNAEAPTTQAAPAPIVAQPSAAPAHAIEPAAAVACVSPDEIKAKVLEIVAEKTGYPPEMLDLDLDLEADLGIDTVKQAEMFAAVRAAYNIPRDENMKLRDFPTLAHVINFAQQRQPGAKTAVPVAAEAAKPEPLPSALAPAAATTPVEPVASATNPAPIASASVEAPQGATAVPLDAIKAKVLEIVAEKTGYPPEMLDLDLDLEADLGIDTVKQAEMFAAVRAAYNIPRDENMKLRDFPTLAHVIEFAQKRQPGAQPSTTTAEAKPAKLPIPTPVSRVPVANFDAANKIPRRVPLPVLRPPLDLCKPTGVTLGQGSRVALMADKGGVGDALAEQLKTKGVEVLRIDPTQNAEALTNCLSVWLAVGPVQGVYWLPALDNEGPISRMDLNTWHEELRLRIKSLYTTMRTLYEQIAQPSTFFVSATRLGGQHGYDDAGAAAPMGGAIVGFTKTYKRERPNATVKAVDFEEGRRASEIAALLIDETLRDTGAVEIGYKNGLRWTVGLEEKPVEDGQPGLALNQNSVFVVTGAAGSIVSAITADLAAASGGTFYLLDLVPEPDPNNPDIARFITDKDNLKRDLFARIQARGERATPALVEKELAALERAQAALSAINAVRDAGGTPHYFSVNLADANGVANVIEQVRKTSGRIDVLLHAAGLERSHFLPGKDPREFDLVFDVKADGWFNLLRAIGDIPLGATVAFSSVAGRFGNGGQTDYSAANDLLCKYTSSFRSTRPQTRGIVIDWTAWGGIGMATRGSIPKMMELAGIDMLPPEAGVPLIRRELTSGGTRGEIVVGTRLGVLLEEWDSTGGLDAAALSKTVGRGPMVGTITGMGIYPGLTMDTTLDPKVQPFLNDHRIDGTPVLPGVMGIEAFAEAALCIHRGWHIEAVEEVNFLAPFKFYKDEPRTVSIHATFQPQGDKLIANCRLIGRRTLPNQPQPQETTHFTARVRVSKQTVSAVTGAAPRLSAEAIVGAAQIYRIYFHGPAYQVLERAWWDGERMIGEMSAALPNNHQPADQPTLMSPRLIELCFQTAGLWEINSQSRMGLPLHVHQVSWLRAPQSAEGRLYALVTPHPEQGSFDAEVVDATGNRYLSLGGYRTVAVPDGLDAESLKALQAVLSTEPAAVS